MQLKMSVSKILALMVLQNYKKFIEMTSNMIYIVALGGGFKCPHKIHLNTQCTPLTGICFYVNFLGRLHGSYKLIIMREKCGRPDSNGFQLK